MPVHSEPSRLYPLGYGFATALLLGPTTDLLVATYPWSPDLISWRFGALGLLGNALILPTIAVGVAAITAGVLGHRRVLRSIAVAAAVGSVLLVAGLVMLMLDALQLRSNIRPDALAGYDFGALRVGVNYLLASALGLWIAFSGWITSTRQAVAERRRRALEEDIKQPLVAGRRSPARV